MSEDKPVLTRQSGKLIVGLTGNISTGKSAVMRLAAEQGALTIDADKVVHELMNSDAGLQAEIVAAFGAKVQKKNGRIDREALGELVFKDKATMRKLEGLVHPKVGRVVFRRINDTEATIIFIEAIKLLEGQLADVCHQIWVTRCSRQRQLERLVICRGLDTETSKARINAQPPQEEKVALADVVVETDGLMKDTKAQFDLFWSRLPSPDEVIPKEILVYPQETMPPSTTTQPQKAAPTAKADPRLDKLKGASAKLAALKKTRTKAAKADDTSKPATEETKEETTAAPVEVTLNLPPDTSADIPIPTEVSEDVEARRARPSDIPSILLLIHKATDGAVRLKRADLLMAFSERSYFIGQEGAQISTVIGWNIENQVGRLEQIYMHPLEQAMNTGLGVLKEIEKSAQAHICEMIAIYLPQGTPIAIRRLFETHGYQQSTIDELARGWKRAVKETIPENNDLLIKVLQERN